MLHIVVFYRMERINACWWKSWALHAGGRLHLIDGVINRESS